MFHPILKTVLLLCPLDSLAPARLSVTPCFTSLSSSVVCKGAALAVEITEHSAECPQTTKAAALSDLPILRD